MDDTVLIKDLLLYYKKFGRHDLVWRKNITPYKILVSEIMLQQTQISRVAPKYLLWMKKFPTLRSLGSSSLKEVLILWQGLGYQRRAKALLTIGKEVDQLPKTYEELIVLPGIGKYTASAIMAFAYDKFSHPVLETNIRTVLIEYFHQGETNIYDGELYDDLNRLLQNRKIKNIGPRHFYYALMDFGAYLKANKISHNSKSAHHSVQSKYEGSLRQLRAKTLFAITNNKDLPNDKRLKEVLRQLVKEGYIQKVRTKYSIL